MQSRNTRERSITAWGRIVTTDLELLELVRATGRRLGFRCGTGAELSTKRLRRRHVDG